MMRHYSRYGRFVGAMILSLGLAAPVMAQAVPRHGDWDRGGYGYGGNSDAYRNGYNAGCVEASTWSGIQAANTILDLPLNDGVIT